MSRKEALSQFINQIHGRPVVVKLNSGVDYRGKFNATRWVLIDVYVSVMTGRKEAKEISSLAKLMEFKKNFVVK